MPSFRVSGESFGRQAGGCFKDLFPAGANCASPPARNA
jgi:hypothetical protein